MKAWGFNTIGNGSDESLVFHPSFQRDADEYAQQLTTTADDRTDAPKYLPRVFC